MKDKILQSIDDLYQEIDKCITDIVKARLEHDSLAEGKALFKMESLMVGAEQELSFLYDYIKTQCENSKPE